ncbi:MAG: PTS sugar transporter subunit IIA [Nitrospinae bacterium]|nr:PTS sugar transporter subunit IIA [Nitrospinota bacterium]
MNVTDFIGEGLIFIGLAPDDKAGLVAAMVDRVVAAGKLAPDRRDPLVAKLMEREALSSTGVGGGVAIPHASGEAVDGMLVAVGQVPGGVDYDAVDGAPVKLLFMIIGSERAPLAHLQLLAAIVRICKNRLLVERLEGAVSPAEAMALLVGGGR